MRKLAAAALSVPVLALVYLTVLVRRSAAARVVAVVAIAAVVGTGMLASAGPRATTARPPTVTVPLTSAAFRTAVTINQPLDAPIAIEFSTPMERSSVEAAIVVDPPTPVDLAWDASGTTLTLTPRYAWSADTYHTVTVEAGALARTGRPLSKTVRSAFLTRDATTAVIEATSPAGKRVALDTGLDLSFSRPVPLESVEAGLRIEPAVGGRLEATGGLGAGTHFRFTPDAPLAADTRYAVTVSGVRTADGELLEPASLIARTAKAPSVVRFRPADGEKRVARDATLSVRFTEAMDRRSTRSAFTVEADGKAVEGTVRFAEGRSVLVFDPASPLPWDARIVLRVDTRAASAAGAPLGGVATAVFTTPPKPEPQEPARTPKTQRQEKPPKSSGGGSVAAGNWSAVERYYLGLMNCTRTGGWVTSTGRCKNPGGRNVAPLQLSSGISSKVSRPYAKLLANRGACDHFIGGSPGDRLRRAGFTSYRWAENIGCRSGNPRSAVLGSHLYFQSEKSYNGGHYVNMMSSKYDRAGIGVWVSGGRVRLVVNFYHP